MEWQPISTAPTDGTRIIVYYPEFDPKNYRRKYGHLPSEECEDEYKLWDDNGIYVCWFDGLTDAQVYDKLCHYFDNPNEKLDNEEIRHGYWRFNSTALDEEYTDGDVVDFQGGIWDGPTHWLPIPKVPK